MAQWNANDVNTGAPIWSGALVNKTPNTTNRNALYGNVTANAFTNGQYTGIVAKNATEIAGFSGTIAHTGWVKYTVGTGGRAGRIQTEVLVAGSMVSSANDANLFVSNQPQSQTVANGSTVTFSVREATWPKAVATYQWQLWNGTVFVDITSNSTYTLTTTKDFVITVATAAADNNRIFRCRVMASGQANAITSNATLLIS